MQNLISTDLKKKSVKITANKLAFLLLKPQIKKHLNSDERVGISKHRNFYEMCNALFQTWHLTGSNFHHVKLIKVKNQRRQQIGVQLSAKLTKAFGRHFQALLIFSSQEIFINPKLA